MVKQPACAAALSSSGLVPFSFSNLVLNEYGVSASTPESVERWPLPARPVPRQTAFALRIMGVSFALWARSLLSPSIGHSSRDQYEPRRSRPQIAGKVRTFQFAG